MPQVAPCDWPVVYGVECLALDQPENAELKPVVEAMASELLWNWTGRVFGTCDEVVRPCRAPRHVAAPSTFEGSGPRREFPGYGSGQYAGQWQPVLVGGDWFNIRCGSCGFQDCACRPDDVTSLHLPGPFVSVQRVTIDGINLPTTSYRVDDKHWLIRTDGEAWPVYQDLNKAPGSVGTWEVEYTRGIPVPAGGQMAAGTLACELAMAMTGDNECNLPTRVQTVSRQGVTVAAVLDNFADLKEGRTGIWAIDSWIASVSRPRSYAAVHSVDRMGRQPWRY